MNLNRVLLLILVAGLTFLVVLLAIRPEMLESVWMWLIGLSGTIIKAFQQFVSYFKKTSQDEGEVTNTQGNTVVRPSAKASVEKSAVTPSVAPDFDGTTITVLRFSDDGTTTVGLLYINDEFYCYTIEDTYREIKVPGETRIPAGDFRLRINPNDTNLTLRYRAKFPDWFDHHLEILDVPEFSSIYIHNGGTHKHTEGCILVSDSLSIGSGSATFTNSKETYKRFYLYITNLLKAGDLVRIRIYDEHEISQLTR